MTVREVVTGFISPRVQADGGWLEYTGEDGACLYLRAKGECARCVSLDRCLQWVSDVIEKETGCCMTVRVTREPFLWRK